MPSIDAPKELGKPLLLVISFFLILLAVLTFFFVVEEKPVLPENWVDLSESDKIELNPLECDLARQKINLEDGQCQNLNPIINPEVNEGGN
ncbi:MAG: hypothetical protein OXF49_03525 [Candidatus Saccharibacteria bacterium]|nr:hypothetical protein [Candidatus Saccharibacteria bacterium]